MEMYLELLINYLDEYSYMIDDKYVIHIDEKRRAYLISLNDKFIKYFKIIRETAQDFPKLDRNDISSEIDFKVFYQYNLEQIRERLINENILERDVKSLSELIFWESLNLSRLAPFLLDKELNEIYILGDDYNIHVEHRKYGKMISNISLTKKEIKSFARFLEFIKGEGIFSTDGILEVDINTYDLHFRILVDSPQITFGNYAFCIRNLRRLYYNLEKILESRSITPEALAILLISVYLKLNIIIAGPPNSGKTTLLNALISELPFYNRKISIEDAKETIDLRREGANQIFYKSSRIRGLDKRRQIIFTLRRSPDYLIIGETLDEYDVKSLFYSLSLGLNVITTIHAYSVDSLLRRWFIHEKVDEAAIKDIDLVVIMEREFESNKRMVKDIIVLLEKEGKIKYESLLNMPIRENIALEKKINDAWEEWLKKIAIKRDINRDIILKIYSYFLRSIRELRIPKYGDFLRMVGRE